MKGKLYECYLRKNYFKQSGYPALSAVSNKSTVQALDGILLIANKDEGTFIICGYDLEKGVKVTISGEDVQINESGAIILNAVKFASVIKNLPDGDISIFSDSNLSANIKSGITEFTLHGLDAETFPLMPELKGEQSLKLSRKVLKDMIASTLFSVSNSSLNQSLNGALFEIKNNQLTVVCAEQNRMALKRNSEGLISSEKLDIKFIVPGKSLAELIKLIGDDEEPVEIELTHKHIIISFDNVIFFSRLIESAFADYKRYIKIEPKTTVIINTQDFLESVDRAAVLTEDRLKTRVKLYFKSGVVEITSVSSIGNLYDRRSIEIYGDDLEIGMNHRYLYEALKAIKDEKILLKFENPGKPLIIIPYNEKNQESKETDIDGCDFLYVVAAVRMRD